MGIKFHSSNNASTLDFDAAGRTFLQEKLNADEKFQRQMRRVVLVAAIILIVGGATTCGLGFAVVIPYGLLHTWALVGASSAVGLGLGGLTVLGNGITIIKPAATGYLTGYRFYYDLKEKLNYPIVAISSEAKWDYLKKQHEDYLLYLKKCKERAREILAEQLTQNTPCDASTGKAIYDFSPLVTIIEDYIT